MWNAEQEIFLRYAKNIIAWNTIQEFYFFGAVGGSEMMVYNAAKLYLALEFECSNHGDPTTTRANMTFYDQLNNINYVLRNDDVEYDPTVVVPPGWWHNGNAVVMKNFYFSRLLPAQYGYGKFIGYKLTTV